MPPAGAPFAASASAQRCARAEHAAARLVRCGACGARRAPPVSGSHALEHLRHGGAARVQYTGSASQTGARAWAVAGAGARRTGGAAGRVCSQPGATPSDASTAASDGTLADLDGLLLAIRTRGDADGVLEARAVELVRSLSAAAGGPLRGFGAGTLVPKRDYTLAELRLHRIEPAAFLSPRDATLEGVRSNAVAAVVAGVAAVSVALHPSTSQLLAGGLGVMTAAMVDQVGNGGAGEALVLDTLGRATSAAYRSRVARHESGHFLVAWLVGILPRAYTLSALDALRSEGARNVQAGCVFCDLAFQREVATGKLSSASLDAYCLVALAGVASEVQAFGQAEGGLNDVQQLDGLLQALAFTQKRSDSQVRWAALATTMLLRRHAAAHDALEAAMASGASVATCIKVLEEKLDPVV